MQFWFCNQKLVTTFHTEIFIFNEIRFTPVVVVDIKGVVVVVFVIVIVVFAY